MTVKEKMKGYDERVAPLLEEAQRILVHDLECQTVFLVGFGSDDKNARGGEYAELHCAMGDPVVHWLLNMLKECGLVVPEEAVEEAAKIHREREEKKLWT